MYGRCCGSETASWHYPDFLVLIISGFVHFDMYFISHKVNRVLRCYIKILLTNFRQEILPTKRIALFFGPSSGRQTRGTLLVGRFASYPPPTNTPLARGSEVTLGPLSGRKTYLNSGEREKNTPNSAIIIVYFASHHRYKSG